MNLTSHRESLLGSSLCLELSCPISLIGQDFHHEEITPPYLWLQHPALSLWFSLAKLNPTPKCAVCSVKYECGGGQICSRITGVEEFAYLH